MGNSINKIFTNKNISSSGSNSVGGVGTEKKTKQKFTLLQQQQPLLQQQKLCTETILQQQQQQQQKHFIKKSSSISYSQLNTEQYSFENLSSSRSFINFSQSRANNKKSTHCAINLSKSVQDLSHLKSKTYWPIPHIELIFLPHFKIDKQYFTRTYSVVHPLAKGAFGFVYKIKDNQTNKEFALKVLSKAKIINDVGVQQLKDEVDIGNICGHHPFIVKCLNYWQTHRHIFLLSELVSHGELFNNFKSFSYELVQLYVAEIASAIDFLHNAGIIYRDLKPENILLDDHYHIQLTDFGLSKWLKFGQRTKTICGTLQYMAPEIVNAEEYGHAVDWWALGVVACRMITDEYPRVTMKLPENMSTDTCDEGIQINSGLPTKSLVSTSSSNKKVQLNESQYQKEIFLTSVVLPETKLNILNPAVKDLLVRLLEVNPKYRIKSVMALERIAFYKNFNFEHVRQKMISPENIFGNSILYDEINIPDVDEKSNNWWDF